MMNKSQLHDELLMKRTRININDFPIPHYIIISNEGGGGLYWSFAFDPVLLLARNLPFASRSIAFAWARLRARASDTVSSLRSMGLYRILLFARAFPR